MSGVESKVDYPSLLKRAYLSLEKLQAKLDAAQRAGAEPIAIVGMGCRLPGGVDNPDSFWRLLHEGRDAITEIPPERWDVERYYDPNPGTPGKMYTRWGGFLDHVDLFDPQFFGIAPREAVSMDPQQRLVLEIAWEALEDAGQNPDALAGSQTGVFIGISGNEYAHLIRDPAKIDLYTPTGNALSVAAGRVSYVLGLQGPSLAVDTACSSSLAAVHLAVQSLRGGECSLALAGGVNLILSPTSSIGISELRMLAPDGRCKTFDAGADGFVRAEGCAMVALKRFSDAMANGDRILALIRGSAVNQDGRSGGLTAPNGPSQEAVIRRALASGSVFPAEVSYVEAHGTGTPLGDPIEVGALAAVLGEGRDPAHPFAIGSVKTNLGHLEAAAGVAGLIKTVLALQHEEIPPHLHLQKPNPHVEWDRIPVTIPREQTPWPAGGARRIAGVSSFGFGGTNAHVVLEEPPAPAVAQPGPERPLHVLTLSAKNGEALSQLAARCGDRLAEAPGSFADVCFTANTGRARFSHRLAIVAGSSAEAREKLAGFQGGMTRAGEPRLAFLFTGQGSQYVGMGRLLFDTQPVFRRALERCAGMLEGHLDLPLLSVLYPPANAESPLDETAYTQPALFALEYALSELWRSWGVYPRMLAGHSVGEYAAACVAGILSVEDAVRLVAARGRLMQGLARRGAMAAVFAPEREVRQRLSGSVCIAALNGPENTVISGDEEAIGEVVRRLGTAGIRTQRLRVSHAFHSSLMDSILPAFEREAEKVRYGQARIPLVSNLTGRMAEAGEMENAAYWVRQLRATVQFRACMENLREQGCDAYLEVGPKSTLLAVGQQCLGSGEEGLWLASLRENRNDWEEMLASLARLWTEGVDVRWDGFDRGYTRRRVSLPTYPFQRKRYWLEVTPEPVETPPAAWKDWLYESRWEPRKRAPGNPDFLPDPCEVAAVVGSQRAALNAECHIELYAELIPQLDSLATIYIAEALRALGWREAPEQSSRKRLLQRLFGILREGGNLSTGTGEEIAARLKDHYPRMNAEVTMLERCGRHLAGVLRGTTDPVEVLFPGGSVAALEKLYRDSPAARVCNTLIQRVVAETVQSLPEGRPLRILELGGGTGGTTSFVLPSLPANAAEYVFTDVSPLFTVRAAATFKSFPFLRCQVLDIERDPSAQGFQPHGFDMVIAANVLHATADLRRTLAHVKQLLAPDGLLILLEATGPQRWLDLIFGLTEGWWKFTDHDLRPDHPLLPAHGWLRLLESAGFYSPAVVPETEGNNAAFAEPAVILARSTPAEKETGTWLIFADSGGVAERLSAALQSSGNQTVLVFPEEDFGRLLQDVPKLRGVVYLSSLDTSNPGDAELRGCASALHLTQALARCEKTNPTRLWFVTRGAQPAGEETLPLSVAQAPLWGLARVVALEHPDLWGGIVDLMPGASPDAEIAALMDEILTPDGEDQIALRGNRRYVPRLVRIAPPPNANAPFRLTGDGTYLITGGLGDLGLEVAEWLVHCGARSLVLTGRTGIVRKNEAIQSLERAGATVRAVAADVADPVQMSRLFERIRNELPPLRGIVHAAAAIIPRTLREMDLDALAQALRAKVSGTWVLHESTRGMDLRFFVLFSSTTSLLGSRSLAHYAAANQFIDTFAHFRRAMGQPALAVNWGIWNPARVDAALGGRSLKQVGLNAMPSRDALAALGALIDAGAVQTTVASIDWNALRSLYEARRRRPFLEHIESAAPAVRTRPVETDFLRRLRQAAPTQRRTLLVQHIQREAAQVLGFESGSMPDAHLGLFEMGMDSLTSVDLKNRLEKAFGLTLPVTVALEFPTIQALAGYMEGALFGVAEAIPPAQEPEIPTDGLSRDDLLALMAEELAAIEERRPD